MQANIPPLIIVVLLSRLASLCLRLCFPSFIAACLPDSPLERIPRPRHKIGLIFMRINSCPIPYLCLSLSVISSDLLPSFLTLPTLPVHPSSSSILHLSLKCFSYLQSPFYSTPTLPCLTLSCLSPSFFYACLPLTEVYHSRGVSQSPRSHFIT